MARQQAPHLDEMYEELRKISAETKAYYASPASKHNSEQWAEQFAWEMNKRKTAREARVISKKDIAPDSSNS